MLELFTTKYALNNVLKNMEFYNYNFDEAFNMYNLEWWNNQLTEKEYKLTKKAYEQYLRNQWWK